MEALFLEHEGYFGALGSFLLHQGITHDEVSRVPHKQNGGVYDLNPNERRKKNQKKKRSMSI